VKNTGAATWYKGGVNLALSNPIDRTSTLYDSSWPSQNRPAYFKEDSVAPGQEATYGFWVNLQKVGAYKEYFTLVADGVTWMNDMGMYFEFNVEAARYTWQYIDQGIYSDQTKTTLVDTASYTIPDRRYYNTIHVKNTGNTTWKKDYVNLGTSGPNDRQSIAYDTSWLKPNRVTTIVENTVKPGEVATFEFWTKGPSAVGDNREYFNLVAENITWMNDMGLHYLYHVNKPYNWSPVSQRAFTDQTLATQADLSNTPKNSRLYLQLKLRNTGTKVWQKNYVNLGASNPTDRISQFRDITWSSINRPTTLVENSVAPGEIGTFEFWVTAPSNVGVYYEYYNLVAENITWFTDYGLHYQINVK
jgi:hypothetical protein